MPFWFMLQWAGIWQFEPLELLALEISAPRPLWIAFNLTPSLVQSDSAPEAIQAPHHTSPSLLTGLFCQLCLEHGILWTMRDNNTHKLKCSAILFHRALCLPSLCFCFLFWETFLQLMNDESERRACEQELICQPSSFLSLCPRAASKRWWKTWCLTVPAKQEEKRFPRLTVISTF